MHFDPGSRLRPGSACRPDSANWSHPVRAKAIHHQSASCLPPSLKQSQPCLCLCLCLLCPLITLPCSFFSIPHAKSMLSERWKYFETSFLFSFSCEQPQCLSHKKHNSIIHSQRYGV